MARPSWVRKRSLRVPSRAVWTARLRQRPSGWSCSSASRSASSQPHFPSPPTAGTLVISSSDSTPGRAASGRSARPGRPARPPPRSRRSARRAAARAESRVAAGVRRGLTGRGRSRRRRIHHVPRASRVSPARASQYEAALSPRSPAWGCMALVVSVAGGRGRPRGRAPGGPRPGPGPTFSVAGGRLRIEVCADDIVRVAFARTPRSSRAVAGRRPKRCMPTPWKVTRTRRPRVTTAKLA